MTPKEYYEHLKAQGICVTCRKARAAENRVNCPACMEKQRKVNYRYYQDNAEFLNKKRIIKNKEIYQQRKAEHICTRCGKHPAVLNRTLCEGCAEYQLEWWRRNRGKSTKI